MTDVTQILHQIEDGDQAASEQLLPLVYDELRKLAAAKMANERLDHTLQATALVHEAYIRLVDADRPPQWNGRGHFFAAAAEAMRRILVERARRVKHLDVSGRGSPSAMLWGEPPLADSGIDVLAIDEALTEFAQHHPEKAELVKLRFFSGLTLAEAAAVLGISTATSDRYWKYARAWLARQLSR